MTKEKDDLLIKYEDYCNDIGLTALRIKKLKVMYRLVKRHLKKPLDKLKTEDITKYVTGLNKGNVYFKIDGGELSPTTISDIKKFLKQFFKWLKGEGAYYPDEVKRISVKIAKDKQPKPKETLEIDEVIKLSGAFKNIDYKIAILILFDSGFRINEFTSVTKENLSWENLENGEKCFWIFCPESKTFQRHIPIPLFTNDLKQYFNSASFQAKKPNEPLINVSYETLLRRIKEISAKLFKKKITFHSLRHSSATYWSNELEYLQLCSRMGWSFDSKQAKIYVRRSKKQNIRAGTITFSNKLLEVEKENNELKSRLDEMNDRLEEQSKKLVFMMNKFLNPIMDKMSKEELKELAQKLK